MSLAEIKRLLTLSPSELVELFSFIRQRENAVWDREIDADFAEGGRLRPLLEEVPVKIIALWDKEKRPTLSVQQR